MQVYKPAYFTMMLVRLPAMTANCLTTLLHTERHSSTGMRWQHWNNHTSFL